MSDDGGMLSIARLAAEGITLRHSERLPNHLKWSEEVLAITKEPVTAAAPIRPLPPCSRVVNMSRHDEWVFAFEDIIPGWRRGRIGSDLVADINSKIQELDASAGG